jgi:hypothetical protein
VSSRSLSTYLGPSTPGTTRTFSLLAVRPTGVEKTEHAYRAVGRRLLELRRSGLIPYDRISDGTRWVVRPPSYDDMEDALTDTANLYRRNHWRNAPVEVHVFTEKDAITGVIERVTDVEVDAIPAPILREIVSDAIEQHIDHNLLEQIEKVEASERDYLHRLAGWLGEQDA